MDLFKIGDSYNLTSHIVVPTYKVNDQGVYKDFEDANYRTHRKIVRPEKITGDFTVKFYSVADYEEFLSAINNNKSSEDGSIRCYVYAHNKRAIRLAYVFIDFDPENTFPYFNVKSYEGFKVTITER